MRRFFHEYLMLRRWILIKFRRPETKGHEWNILDALGLRKLIQFTMEILFIIVHPPERAILMCIYGKFQFPIFHYSLPVSMPCHAVVVMTEMYELSSTSSFDYDLWIWSRSEFRSSSFRQAAVESPPEIRIPTRNHPWKLGFAGEKLKINSLTHKR